MNGYENGKIYKIVGGGLTYYGSTIQTLEERLRAHKGHYNKYLRDNKHNYSSFEILKLEDYKIELVEAYPCSSKKELELREKYYITSFECCNQTIPRRTREEYCEANKDKIKKQQQEWGIKYREGNEELVKRKKEFYDKHQDEILEYKKEYYEANKELIKQKAKAYRDANKELLKQKAKERYQARKIKDIN
jgi:hypothetical protein